MSNDKYQLILWDNHVSTFHTCIEALMKYLHFSEIQAEQVAIIVDNNESCVIRHSDSIDELKVLRSYLYGEGLSSTIKELKTV